MAIINDPSALARLPLDIAGYSKEHFMWLNVIEQLNQKFKR